MTDILSEPPKSQEKGFGGFVMKDPEEQDPIPVHAPADQLVGMAALRHILAEEATAGPQPSPAYPETTLAFSEVNITPDAHINLSDAEVANPRNVIDAIERQHYARVPPSFPEQANDPTRTNSIESRRYAVGSDETFTTTEYEGLRQLRAAIEEKIAAGSEYADDLQDMLDNLTFIGEKELAEGARGIGILWKDFLDKDERNVLCLGIIGDNDKGKSTPYITGRILDTWSDEELARYSGRIIERPEQLVESGVDPEHALIAITDDSTISGRQLRERYRQMQSIPGIEPYMRSTAEETDGLAFVKSVEVHLIVADEDLLREGLQTNDGFRNRMRVKAYYKAHNVNVEDSVHNGLYSRKTSAHSSMDHGFNWTLLPAFGSNAEMPPLAYIKRQYRDTPPRVIIESDGTLARTSSI